MPFARSRVKRWRGLSCSFTKWKPICLKVSESWKERSGFQPMANIDVEFGMTRRARPAAMVEDHQARRAEAQPLLSRANARPEYARVDAGQLARAVILVMLSFGAVHFFHSAPAPAGKASGGVVARPV